MDDLIDNDVVRVKSSPGFAYAISRINPLYFESQLRSIEQLHTSAENVTQDDCKIFPDASKPNSDILIQTKQPLRRSVSLPAKLGEYKKITTYNWLGISIINLEKDITSQLNQIPFPSASVQIGQEYNAGTKHLDSRSDANIVLNPSFVKSIQIIPESINHVKSSDPHINKTGNMIDKTTNAQNDSAKMTPICESSTITNSFEQTDSNKTFDKYPDADSIVSDNLLEMTSTEPKITHSDVHESQPQEPLSKHSNLKTRESRVVFKELSQAITQSDQVKRVQRASAEFKSQSVQTPPELAAYSETGRCTPQQERPSPLSLVIRMFSGHLSNTQLEQDDVALQLEDEQGDHHYMTRRKSWFQRLTSLKGRPAASNESSRSASPDPYAALENANLRDIFIHNINTEVPAGTSFGRVPTPENQISNSRRESSSRVSSSRRHVSFSAETHNENDVSMLPVQNDASNETGPMSVEALVQLLSEANADEKEKELIWNKFYSSQLSAAQVEDSKMLRKWQATRHAKDRNLSIFTLDVGRAASLKRRTLKEKKFRKLCRAFSIVLVVALFIGIIVLVSWLGSGGRKVFGSL